MTANRKRIGLFLAVLALSAGCGGTIVGNSGPDGATTTIPCSAMGACGCREASDRCAARTEACWCDSECDPQIVCKCGGGRFLACEERTVITACSNELAAVMVKCAGHPLLPDIASLCVETRRDPNCTAACLATLNTTGSCSEIDCGFCKACDCAAPTAPSPFADCVQACGTPLPPL